MYVRKLKIFLLLVIAGLFSFTVLVPASEKPRIVILSDISGHDEPDDYQSFIRFLLYSNEFDVEGIIGTGSVFGPDRGDIEHFNTIIDAYGEIRNNLLLHKEGFPAVDELKSVVRSGQRGTIGMAGVGNGKNTPGSDLIIEALLRDDSRPLWVTIWGATGTLAQALWDIKNNRGFSESEINETISKLRVYDIAGQDNAGGWITNTFPDIFYIRSSEQFLGFAQGVISDAQGGNISVANDGWFANNIMNQGSYGSIYPSRKFMYEGDSPSFMHLIPNGLSDPERVHYGGWGGRFQKEKIKNPETYRGSNVNESAFHDFYMYNDATDKWIYNGTTYNNVFCALFRWREEYQYDFQARMQWAMLSYSEANHNPVAIVNGDNTKNIIYKTVQPGSEHILDASGSFDPDGDNLSFDWIYYREPGNYPGDININNPDSKIASIQIPADAANYDLHVILRIKDDGIPSLFAYRRVVFSVQGSASGSVPAGPTNLAVEKVKQLSAVLVWDNNTDNEDNYIIEKSLNQNSGFAVYNIISSNSDNHIITGLRPGTSYYFRIKAINESGSSPYSNIVNVVTDNYSVDGRITDGLMVLYRFNERSGSIVNDVSGYGEPLNLVIENTSNVEWDNSKGLLVNSPTVIRSAGFADKIINGNKETNEITIETWIETSKVDQNGPARIVTLSKNTNSRLFTVGQENIQNKYLFDVRVRTDDENGLPSLQTSNSFSKPEIRHLVYIRDSSGEEYIYVNGQRVASGIRKEDFKDWSENNYFALANELTGNRSWLGKYFLVAVYNLAIDSEDVIQHYYAGLENEVVSSKIPEVKEAEIVLFPNPADNFLYVRYSNQGRAIRVKIFDSNGKIHKISQDNNAAGYFQIDISGLPDGTYFCVIYDENSNITGKGQFIKLN